MKRLSADDPRRVGPYDIRMLLGTGGMGTVYLAQAADGQFVALKVMSKQMVSDAQSRERFTREVQAASKVSGRFTARIIDSDPDAPSPWYASEYIPGVTLQEAVELAGGRLPPEAVETLAWGLLEAIRDVHAAGIVHRDLKPANIILSQSGPYVIDFGIAHIEGERGLTRTGFMIGTIDYLAPERIDGGSPQASWDIFSLGAVLVYALTGHVPFNGMHAIVTRDPDLSGVPIRFMRLIKQCLSKSPTRRLKLSDIQHLAPGSKTAAINGTMWLPPLVATRILHEATKYPSGTTRRVGDNGSPKARVAGESSAVGRARVPSAQPAARNDLLQAARDRFVVFLAEQSEKREQAREAREHDLRIQREARKLRQEERRRPGSARVPRAPVEKPPAEAAKPAAAASKPRSTAPKPKTSTTIGNVFPVCLGILVVIAIALGVVHEVRPTLLPKQVNNAVEEVSHFHLDTGRSGTSKPSPSPSPKTLGAPAVHFASGALGKTFVQTDPSSNIDVTGITLKNSQLVVSVTVTGYANEGDAPFSDSCERIDDLVPNKYFTAKPDSFKTSGPNLANEANTMRTGTITFNVDLPGTYSLLTECQGPDVAQSSALGHATIDGFVGVLDDAVGSLAVLEQQRQGSDLIVIMPSYNKVNYGKFCLKTSSGPQVVTKVEKFGQNGLGYTRLHFRNAPAKPILYTSCSGAAYSGTGLQLQ